MQIQKKFGTFIILGQTFEKLRGTSKTGRSLGIFGGIYLTFDPALMRLSETFEKSRGTSKNWANHKNNDSTK
jgi:hypothetical protein